MQKVASWADHLADMLVAPTAAMMVQQKVDPLAGLMADPTVEQRAEKKVDRMVDP